MPVRQVRQVQFDGSAKISLTIPFIPAPAPSQTSQTGVPSIEQLSPGVNPTGGSLAGGHSYFYSLAAIDPNGQLGPCSGNIQVIVPSGSNVNQISLVGFSPFDRYAQQFNVYRAIDDPQYPLLILANAVLGTGGSYGNTPASGFGVGQFGGIAYGGGSAGSQPFNFIDTGLATSQILPPSQTLVTTRAYWRLTGTTTWNLGAEATDRTQTALTFTLPINIAGQSIDVQLRSVGPSGWETPQGIGPIQSFVLSGQDANSLAVNGFTAINTFGNLVLKNIENLPLSSQSINDTALHGITGGSVTITTNGNPILLILSGSIAPPSSGTVTFSFYRDGSQIGPLQAYSTGSGISMIFIDGAAFAGSHTYAVQWQNSAAVTTTLNNGNFQVIELG